MIKVLLILLSIIFLFSCTQKKQVWEIQWMEHRDDFKKVAQLFKENKLAGRFDVYNIPDSINIKAPLDQIFFSHKDTLTDTSCTLTFYLDTIRTIGRKRPAIVYTTNQRIIDFFKTPLSEATKIEDNWYYQNFRYW